MSHTALSKIQADTAAEVCQHFVLGQEAQDLLQNDSTPQEFLDLLVAHQQYTDATHLLAYALPKRDAVWWACLCIQHVARHNLSAADSLALQASQSWVLNPHESHRRAAMQAAEALAFQTAASWAAVAAFWSGGSLAPADVPAVSPGEYLTAQAVTGAVMLAAARCTSETYLSTYRLLIEEGTAVAAGRRPWSTAAAREGAKP